jgi:transposase
VSLKAIAEGFQERNDAVRAACRTGTYSYREIAEHFGLHLATVGRTIRRRMP